MGFVLLATGALVGISVALCLRRENILAAILGGAGGGLLAGAALGFFGTLYGTDDPEYRDKWGHTVEAALFAMILTGFIGAVCGGAAALVTRVLLSLWPLWGWIVSDNELTEHRSADPPQPPRYPASPSPPPHP